MQAMSIQAVKKVVIEVLKVLKKDFKKWEIFMLLMMGVKIRHIQFLKRFISIHKNLKVISFASNSKLVFNG